MKLHQSVLTSFFYEFITWRKNNTNEVKDSVIFFTNQYLIYRYIVIVAKSRGLAVRLTDFLVVSRECDEISWDPAKSNQFLTLDFL